MKITANTRSFRAAWKTVASVVPSRSPKLVLSSVRFEADGQDGSLLSATDLEVWASTGVVGVQVDRYGAIQLPAESFGKFLDLIDAEDFELVADGDSATVTADGSELTFQVYPADTFPVPPESPERADVSLTAADLLLAIRRTSQAADPESTTYALGGCLAEFAGESFSLVATNTYWLAHQVVPAECSAESGPRKLIIPVKFLKLLSRVLPSDETPIDLTFDGDKSVCVRCDRLAFRSRLVEGRYPPWRKILPASVAHQVDIAVPSMMTAARRVALATTDESRAIHFCLTPGQMELSGSNEKSKARAVIEVRSESSDRFALGSTWLTRLLDSLQGIESATWRFNDAKQVVHVVADQFQATIQPITTKAEK